MTSKKSPLVEAMLEVIFKNNSEGYDATLPGLFFNKVQDKFPHKGETSNVNIEMVTEDGTVDKIKAPLTRFKDDNGNLLQFTKDLIIFNRLMPDVSWEGLKSSVLNNIEDFIDVNNNSLIKAVRLQYLNVIEFPEKPSFSDMFTFKLPRPITPNYKEVAKFDMTMNYQVQSMPVEVNIERIRFGESSKDAVMFEITVSNIVGEHTFDRQALEDWMVLSHGIVCEIFNDHMNPKFLEQYEQW